ncbi:MAG: KpsF/GutQ family sugar-phosphate isomerase [Acidobacteria bacterium]|nr:KpsF/GutQ family sugar-phosphate isomerase [Acidobacteriota bacterium]
MKDRIQARADVDLARAVLRTEADAVAALIDRLDERFAAAVQLLADCRGRVIVSGIGKSGIIARKIAATLSSTGTSAYFVHPTEAVHGDIGAVRNEDLLIALSHSGETPEMLRLAELTKRLGVRIIGITDKASSPLGQAADVALECGVSEEACPLNLAPTASTTAALALGDALAMTLLVRKGFREEDFANLHPGGQLGKRLMRIERLMHTSEQLPLVDVAAPLREVVATMSAKGFGMACVTDADAALAGIITDGDLRRALAAAGDLPELQAADLMTREPITIRPSALAVEALALLEEHRVTALVVVDDTRRVLGVVHLHDLWRTELF